VTKAPALADTGADAEHSAGIRSNCGLVASTRSVVVVYSCPPYAAQRLYHPDLVHRHSTTLLLLLLLAAAAAAAAYYYYYYYYYYSKYGSQ